VDLNKDIDIHSLKPNTGTRVAPHSDSNAVVYSSQNPSHQSGSFGSEFDEGGSSTGFDQ
jgi:hypothetical protein